ncbi:MAG: DNA-binding protein [Gammaproteobacteria bacterium]
MAKTGITEKQVADAANRMVDEGEAVSARRLREAIGGGSMSTILRHLQAWRAGQQAQQGPPPDMPDTVRETALRALQDVWATANRQAREAIDEIRTAAGSRIHDSKRDLEEAIAAAQELEGHLTERTAELTTADERTAALERELTARDAEVRLLQEQLEAAQKAADERCVILTTERVAALLGQNQSTVDGK